VLSTAPGKVVWIWPHDPGLYRLERRTQGQATDESGQLNFGPRCEASSLCEAPVMVLAHVVEAAPVPRRTNPQRTIWPEVSP